MSRLEQLALMRSDRDLPKIPGATLVERLINGRNLAEAALREYVGTLDFNEIDAEAVSSEVRAWEMRNEDRLADIFADTGQEVLPSDLKLELGATLTQQWVIAQFNAAARGLGPWMSGAVHRTVRSPEMPEVNERWAAEDGHIRLQVFRTILGMRESGDLERIFRPKTGDEGLSLVSMGPTIPIWLVVLVVLAVVAGIVVGVAWYKTIEDNNRLMDRICSKAQADGDKETVRWCIEATRKLQDPYKPVAEEVGKVLLWLGGGYLAVRYAIPWLLDMVGERAYERRA